MLCQVPAPFASAQPYTLRSDVVLLLPPPLLSWGVPMLLHFGTPLEWHHDRRI
jgi:hypothetical protein